MLVKTFKQMVAEGANSDTKNDGKEYQAFFAAALKKFGVSSPGELKGDVEKKFYDYIDANWEADDEKAETYDGSKKKKMKENLRKDIAKMSAKFPEGSKVKMKKNGNVGKVLSVTKDSIKVAHGDKTMDHTADELELVEYAIGTPKKKMNASKNKEEGNAFTGALNAAREKGDSTFIVSGKKYKVEDMEGDEGDEEYVPHKMYKDGKVADAPTEEEHNRLKDLGWTHEKPA